MKGKLMPPFPKRISGYNDEGPFEDSFTQAEYDATEVPPQELDLEYAKFLADFKAKRVEEFNDQDDASFVLERVWQGSFDCDYPDGVFMEDNPKDADGRKARLELVIHDPKAKLNDIRPVMKCKIRKDDDGNRRLCVELTFTAQKFAYKQKMLSDVCEPCSRAEFEKFLKFRRLAKMFHEEKMREIRQKIAIESAERLAQHYGMLRKGADPRKEEEFLRAVIG